MNSQVLVLADFQRVDLPDNQFYLSVIRGQYEITLEPHMITGFCIGIYYHNENLALEKKAVWFKNHPGTIVPDGIPTRALTRAVEFANQLLSKYVV